MKTYRMHYRQELAMSLAEAWKFSSSPNYLNEITPTFFHVDILSPLPDEIYGGLIVEYSMRAVLSIPMTWVSEISQYDKPRRFVYLQLIGPFKFLSHEVCLTETAKGIIVEDIIHYAMQLGWLGQLLNKLIIAEKLNQIFAYRRDYLASRWGVNIAESTVGT